MCGYYNSLWLEIGKYLPFVVNEYFIEMSITPKTKVLISPGGNEKMAMGLQPNERNTSGGS
jgi:hypothetical protein